MFVGHGLIEQSNLQSELTYYIGDSKYYKRSKNDCTKLDDKSIYVGNGSACSSKNRFSRVIEACGYPNDVLDGVIRISFSLMEITMENNLN